MKKLIKCNNKHAFTLVEMLIVLLIISVLSLLIIPNLNGTSSKVNEDGMVALEQLIISQQDLYELRKGTRPSIQKLAEDKYITDAQLNKAIDWGIIVE